MRRWTGTCFFLPAGPRTLAERNRQSAALLAALIVPFADVVPIALFAALFSMVTAVITEFITNLGSIVLMLPVAVDVAFRQGPTRSRSFCWSRSRRATPS